MKNLIKIIILLFIGTTSYSQQLTVKIQSLQYTNNGQPTIGASDCGNIDLSSSTSTSINFGINLSKPNNQVVGLSDLYVYTQKSSSDYRVQKSWVQIPESFWSHPLSGDDTYSTTSSFSINSSDFNVSGGTLFVVFKSNSGVEYISCSYSIIKAQLPTFTLSPTNTSIACGDTSVRNFTVTPTNIPSGSSITYQWSYNGWSGTASTSNTIMLSPVSSTYLPSTVSVTPYLNGVAKTPLTCAVSRAPFVSIASITGNSSICSNAATTYTITNLALGNSVSSWTVSDPSVIALVNNGNSATLTKIGTGTVTLTATLTNSCGQTTTISKNIIVGGPIIPTSSTISGSTYAGFSQTLQYTLNGNSINGGTSYQWSVSAPMNDAGGPTCAWQIMSGQGTKTITLKSGCIASNAVVRVVATGSCGVSNTIYLYVSVGISPCPPAMLRLSQNPIKNGNLTVSVIPYPIPCNPNARKSNSINNEIRIFDFKGNLVFNENQKLNEFTISNLDLKKGVYHLQVLTENGDVLKQKIIIE